MSQERECQHRECQNDPPPQTSPDPAQYYPVVLSITRTSPQEAGGESPSSWTVTERERIKIVFGQLDLKLEKKKLGQDG
jgi:hypothetical protein